MDFSDGVIKVLDELSKKFGVMVDWTGANVLPYVQTLGNKIIAYEIATSITWIVLGVLFIFASIVLFKKSKNIMQNIDDFFGCICYVVSGCLFILGIITIFEQSFDIIKCLTIPEMVWLDYIKSLTVK